MIQNIRKNTQQTSCSMLRTERFTSEFSTRLRCWLLPLLQYCTESSTQGNEERHKRHPHMKGEDKAISIQTVTVSYIYNFPKNQQKITWASQLIQQSYRTKYQYTKNYLHILAINIPQRNLRQFHFK